MGVLQGQMLIDGADEVVPGIIDVHGDAFERAVMPRGWVAIDFDLALAANEVQLLDDRGRIAAGQSADLVVVDPPTAQTPPRVRRAVVGGETGFVGP